MTGVHRVDERVLAAMEAFNDVAPAHNPPYVAAMRLLESELPEIPLVAAFETGFHETIAPAEHLYAVPLEWAEKYGIRRWGFHGASHRYIAERTAQLLKKPEAKIISCHLGGSSSLCAIWEGKSEATQHGHEPADPACRKTTASATSIPSPCRSSCGPRARRSIRFWTTWPIARDCWGLAATTICATSRQRQPGKGIGFGSAHSKPWTYMCHPCVIISALTCC